MISGGRTVHVKPALKHLEIVFAEDPFKLPCGQRSYMAGSDCVIAVREHRHFSSKEESES